MVVVPSTFAYIDAMDIDKMTLNAWHDDPANWKLGIFYFNKEDTRLFPPKRFGIGWTINFANPNSILSLLALTALS